MTNEILEFNNKFCNIINSVVNRKCSREHKSMVIYVFLLKSFRMHNAIVELVRSGYSLEGNILLRSNINACISLKWLANKNSEERFRRYVDYYTIYQEKGIERLLKFNQLDCESIELLTNKKTQIENTNRKIREKYVTKNGKFKSKDWSGVSIETMAIEVGMEHEYGIYSELSNHEHLNSIVTEDIFDEKFDIDSNKEDKEVGNAQLLMYSIYFMMVILDVRNSLVIPNVDYLEEEFKVLYNKINSPKPHNNRCN